MKSIVKLAGAALLGATAIAFTATSASAYIVCNREGECWHVKHRHEYHPEFGLVIHTDDWRWRDRDRDHYRWREHEGEGRGYWHNGVWITF
jgi:hypothetical protein